MLAAEASQVIADCSPERGYVFNLGHGVLPDTDPDVLTRLVDLVRNFEFFCSRLTVVARPAPRPMRNVRP